MLMKPLKMYIYKCFFNVLRHFAWKWYWTSGQTPSSARCPSTIITSPHTRTRLVWSLIYGHVSIMVASGHGGLRSVFILKYANPLTFTTQFRSVLTSKMRIRLEIKLTWIRPSIKKEWILSDPTKPDPYPTLKYPDPDPTLLNIPFTFSNLTAVEVRKKLQDAITLFLQ